MSSHTESRDVGIYDVNTKEEKLLSVPVTESNEGKDSAAGINNVAVVHLLVFKIEQSFIFKYFYNLTVCFYLQSIKNQKSTKKGCFEPYKDVKLSDNYGLAFLDYYKWSEAITLTFSLQNNPNLKLGMKGRGRYTILQRILRHPSIILRFIRSQDAGAAA